MPERLEQLKAALAGRYTIEKELGQGGMATVYLAQDVRHHREVAIKVLRPDLAAALGPERFLREIRIAANLNHPHILALFDSGEADGFLYYVMPYIKGQTLRDRIDKEGELPVPETVRIIREVVDALAFAHSEGVVHRDIKPDNVMLTGGHAVVADFGIAKAVSESTGRGNVTTAGVALGTPAYMAPEQAAADPQIDHRADIYAIGTLAYELLTGRTPFTGSSPQAILAAQVTEQPEPVTKYRDQVSGELEAVVMKCLAKKPADRWQTAGEMLPYLDTMTTSSGGITPTQTLAMGLRRTGVNRAVVAVAVIAIAVLGIVLARSFSSTGSNTTLQGERRQLTFSGDIRQVAIGPDGQSLAYVNSAGALFVRDVGADGGVLQRAESGAFWPTWHPDGSSLMYQDETTFTLYRLPKLSGEATKVLSLPFRVLYSYAPDGTYLIAGGGYVYWGPDPNSIDWAAPDPESVTAGRLVPLPDGVRTWGGGDRVSLSPDGRWIAFLGMREALGGLIGVVATDGSGGSIVVEDKALFISGGGRLDWSSESDAIYYLASLGSATSQSIWRVGIDPESGRPDGTDVMVFDEAQPRQFDVAPGGDALAVVGGNAWYNVFSGTGDGDRTVRMDKVTTGTMWTLSPHYSADGETLIYSRFVGFPLQSSIHVRTVATSDERVIRLQEGLPCCVTLSPAGDRVAYYSLEEDGRSHLRVLDVASEETTPVGAGYWLSSIAWTPDGRSLVFIPPDQRTLTHLDLTGSPQRSVSFEGISSIDGVVVSPDGQHVALAAYGSGGALGLWIGSIEGGVASLVRPDIGYLLGWTENGILFRDGDSILSTTPGGGPETVFAKSAGLAQCSIGGVTAAPATGDFACAVLESSTDVWYVTGLEF